MNPVLLKCCLIFNYIIFSFYIPIEIALFVNFLIKDRTQINTRIELRIFAITIPHQTPTIPPLRVIAKTRMKSRVKKSVRSKVAINAFIPFPIPWNSEEESIPREING